MNPPADQPELPKIKMIIILFIISFILFTGLFSIRFYMQSVDPHSSDEDYCKQYARTLNQRLTVDYLINPAVAESVCSCTYVKFGNYTVHGVEYPPTYPGQYECVRRV